MVKVYVSCSGKEQMEWVGEMGELEFLIYDGKETERKAKALMNHWGAREKPFAIVFNDQTPLRAFYSEDSDVMDGLRRYLENKDYEDDIRNFKPLYPDEFDEETGKMYYW